MGQFLDAKSKRRQEDLVLGTTITQVPRVGMPPELAPVSRAPAHLCTVLCIQSPNQTPGQEPLSLEGNINGAADTRVIRRKCT